MRHAARLSAFLAFVVPLGCVKPPAGKADAPPAPVVVAVAGKKTAPVRARAIGSVKAVASVSVRPRVGGELTGVFFREGDLVADGQKLFTIDPRPYEAAVQLAEKNMAKNQAVLKGAELALRRVERVKTGGAGSALEYDAALTAVASATAAVEADRAALHSAKVQAGFTTITTPLAGRVGELLVSRGNLVDANAAAPLVVINQVSPIFVAFALPEQQLPTVLAARKRGPLRVEADLRGGGPRAVGELAFVDNAADPQTGTVGFKATFPNADGALWPGLFVDVTLALGERPDSVVVPAAAVQSGQVGAYVYVVTKDAKAEARPVAVAFEADGEAVVASGLAAGEAVVTEGQLRLAPGVAVEVKKGAAQ